MSKILKMQLLKSKSLILFLTLVLLCSTIGLLLIYNIILILTFYSSLYFLVFLISMSVGTAFHESAHFSILHDLGFEIDNITAHRIGDVSFRIIDMENLTSDQGYQVAKAPFVRKSQYILDTSMLIILVILNLSAPLPLNIFLAFFTCLVILSIIANMCAYIVIRKKKQSGLVVSIARTTSRGDLDEIVEWNRKQNESATIS